MLVSLTSKNKIKNDNENIVLNFEIKNMDLKSEIIDLYLNGNNLYIITAKEILTYLMVDWNSLKK